jgi:hypothetical protein
MPPGTYKVTNQLEIRQSNVVLKGAGVSNSAAHSSGC